MPATGKRWTHSSASGACASVVAARWATAPAAFRMNGKAVEQSLTKRLERMDYRKLGLPTQKKLIPLRREYQELYRADQ